MARDLATKQNVEPADSDYPYGRIKDDTGIEDGTPVDEPVYGDFHQFFARVFAKSGLAYNNLPDNDYSGFQFYEAAQKLWKRFIGVLNTSTGINVLQGHIGNLIVFAGTSGSTLSSVPATSTLEDGDSFTFLNSGNYDVTIQGNGSSSINGGSDVSLIQQGDFIELVLDKPNDNWLIANYKITPIVVADPKAAISKYNVQTNIGSAANTTILFPNEELDVDNQFDPTTGIFKGKAIGLYQLNVVLNIDAVSGISPQPVALSLHKNGVQLGNSYAAMSDWTGTGDNMNFSTLVDVSDVDDEYTIVLTNGSGVAVNVYGRITYHFVKQ